MKLQPILHRLQSHTMYEQASFITDYAVKVQMVLDKDRSAKRYKVRDIRGLQSLIEKKSDNLDSLYIKWIITKYSQNKMQMVEDILSKAIPALERYQDLKKRNQLQSNHKNLQRIRDIHQLLDIMDEYEDKRSRSEQKDSVEQGFYDRGEAELVHDDSKIKIVIPKTEKASCYFGMGTKWCTTGDRDNQFNSYTRDGATLYYLFFKGVTDKKNYKWAVHIQPNNIELFDAQDGLPRPTLVLKIRKKYPILQKIFKDSLYFDESPSDKLVSRFLHNEDIAIDVLSYVEKPTEKIKRAALAIHPSYIQSMSNPSEELQLMAVMHDRARVWTILKIKKPTEKVQIAAVTRNGWAIEYIRVEPSERVRKIAKKNRTKDNKPSFIPAGIVKVRRLVGHDVAHRLQSHAMYEKASFIQDYAVKVQMVLDKDHSAKRYKVRDIRGLQKLIEKKSDNLDSIYIKWIIQKYSQNKMQMVEDILSKAIPALERYQDLKKRNQLQPTHKNLQKIKDIHQLLDIMDGYQDTQSRSEQKESTEQGFYDRGEAVLTHDDSKIKVVVPKTEKASCYFGMGTKWCTTGDRNNAFNSYTRDGYDLYYIFFKGVTDKKNYKWAIARKPTKNKYDTVEMWDAQNRTPTKMSIAKVLNKYPALQKIFKSTVFDMSIDPILIVKDDPEQIKFMHRPSEEVQIAAVSKRSAAIRHLDNISEKVLTAAVRNDAVEALVFIKNYTKVKLTERVKLEAVRRDWRALRQFDDRSPVKLVEEALRHDRHAIHGIVDAIKTEGIIIKLKGRSRTSDVIREVRRIHKKLWGNDDSGVIA